MQKQKKDPKEVSGGVKATNIQTYADTNNMFYFVRKYLYSPQKLSLRPVRLVNHLISPMNKQQ